MSEQKFMREETANLAEKDAELFKELSEELNNVYFSIIACGQDGHLEMDKVKKLVPAALKALVNYI